ncbi:hypothetical protein ES702_02486 [subsurface metagenome]
MLNRRFGLVVGQGPLQTQKLRLAKELGVGWVHLDPVWFEFETSSGVYDESKLAQLDEYVRLAREHGFKLQATLNQTPEFARVRPGDKTVPPNLIDYANFVSFLIDRYKPEAFEPWNEPWYDFDGSNEEYFGVVRTGYETAKAVKPDIKVGLQYGLSQVSNIYEFLQPCQISKFPLDVLYALGVSNYYDYLSCHIYHQGDPAEKVGADLWNITDPFIACIESFLANKGESRDIWITEIGWKSPPITEEQQADFMYRGVKMLLELPYIKYIQAYRLQALSSNPLDGPFSMLYDDLTPKPVYTTYKQIVAEYPTPISPIILLTELTLGATPILFVGGAILSQELKKMGAIPL